MKEEQLKLIERALSIGAKIEACPILRPETTIDLESFDLVDRTHRDYITRVYKFLDIYEIIRVFPEAKELHKELYNYHIRFLYRRLVIKGYDGIYKSQRSKYDLYYMLPKNIKTPHLEYYQHNRRIEFYGKIYRNLFELYRQRSKEYILTNHIKKCRFMHNLVGNNFVCVDINCTPNYVWREDLVWIRKEIF